MIIIPGEFHSKKLYEYVKLTKEKFSISKRGSLIPGEF